MQRVAMTASGADGTAQQIARRAAVRKRSLRTPTTRIGGRNRSQEWCVTDPECCESCIRACNAEKMHYR